ncbi:MAG: transporter permease [Brevibacillus sp.]|jgi:multiple sugar transport system permease protein|nr:transporter permease [Brevibacillus sp.]
MINRSIFFRIVQYLFALLVIVWTLGPYLWLFISSISYRKDLMAKPLSWIPGEVTWERYYDIFMNSANNMTYTFKVSLYNTFLIAATVTFVALIVGGLAAYAFARLRFGFQHTLMKLFLFIYMIPSIVIVIPLYMMISRMGLLDSKLSLILLNLTFVIPYVIWIMQSYFGSVSKEFEEAASIDGCTRFQTIRHIIFPLALPGFIATAILSFLASWDEFFFGLIFTSTLEAKTISVAIAEFSGKFGVDYGLVAAAGVIASLPPVIIALVTQKYLVRGMTAGGVKE